MTKARDLADLISAGNPLADGAISVSEISDLTATAAEINQLDNTADLPDIRPSLLLDFANSKTLDPRITFTRGSTATYWDGKTTAKAEENLLIYSQVLEAVSSGGNWSFQAATITDNDATAPDGTTTAAKLQGDGTSSEHRLITASNNNTPVTNSTGQFAFSIFAKAGTNNYIQIRTNQSDNGYANFDISSGTAHPTTASASITDVGSGWYRCEIIFADSVTTPANISVHLVTSTSASRPEINTLSTYVHLWGAQLEDRTSVTAYTATTSSPIVKYQPVLQTAASGEARFDHDPVTGESKGLLIEEARTNLVPHSTDPTATNMTSVRSASTDISAIAPDGTFTARKHTSDATSTGEHYFATTNASITSGSTYTASYYIKDCGVGYAYIKFYNAFPDTTITVDLSDKTVNTLTASTFSAIEVTDVGNDWYRISVTQTADATSSTQSILFGYTTSSTSGSFLGDGYKGAFIWGMQLEVGSFPTSYIPTSGSTVTRSGDLPLISGSNFTSWFNDMPLSAYVEYDFQTSAINQRIFSIDTNGYDPRLVVVGSTSSGSGPIVELYSGGTFYTSMNSDSTTPTETGTHKLAFAFADNDAANSKDGAAVVTDTTFVFPSNFSQIRLGSQANGNNFMQGTIKKLAFYPKRLPNATLQAMTEA